MSKQPNELEKILKNLLIQHADRLWNLKPPDIDLSKALAALRQRERVKELDARIDELERHLSDIEHIADRIAQLKVAKDKPEEGGNGGIRSHTTR